MKKLKVHFEGIPVLLFREGSTFISYSPALDISSCGKTKVEAKKRFQELLKIFLKELMDKGTLEQALSDLGWKKKQQQWNAPKIESFENMAVAV